MVQILEFFLYKPLSNGTSVLNKFAELPGAVMEQGSKPMQRFVYVPGKRKDRVLLVAHCDTVWDQNYGRNVRSEPVWRDGVYCSATDDCGIGADDRAGCALLWTLRDSGHSLLVVDGEEKGKIGSVYLKKQHKKLYRELNRHQFMIELDWEGMDTCIFRHIPHTEKFKWYITRELRCVPSGGTGGCDLQVLCSRVCGVNLGVGYHKFHTAKEHLSLEEWENTREKLTAFLQQPQPKFKIPFFMRMASFFKRCKPYMKRLLNK